MPARYRSLFSRRILESHRGYDPGALAIARRLASRFDVTPHLALTTRLLIDPNRSLHHPNVFSTRVTALDAAERREIIDRYYQPHRDRVEQSIRQAVARRETVLHVGVHTFTPVRRGERRRADVGLLYDPARPRESQVACEWQRLLQAASPRMTVRRNYPYRGAADGLTTHLRTLFAGTHYLGLELEVNQRHARKPRSLIVANVVQTLVELVRTAEKPR